MVVPLVLFFSALSTGQDQTPLRSNCDEPALTPAKLPAGTPVEIRFRLSAASDCFHISSHVAGHPLMGDISAYGLSSERFERDRSSADGLVGNTSEEFQLVTTATQKSAEPTDDPALDRAVELLEANQPTQAYELLENALKRHRNDANVLLLTGLAAYRSDQLLVALDYWKQSLDLAANNVLSRIYERVCREAASEQTGKKMVGRHIVLRYEGEALDSDTARSILTALDEDYSRISDQLGCTSNERIVAIVLSRDTYLGSTGAAEWSSGQYDGRIHIAWTAGKQVDPQMRRLLSHELVHACLTSLPSGGPRWPTWLQEGLAQKLSGDRLSPVVRERLHHLAVVHRLPRLEDLQQDWSELSIQNVRLCYCLALAAVDALYDNYASYGIRKILNSPQRFAQVTAELDRKLGF